MRTSPLRTHESRGVTGTDPPGFSFRWGRWCRTWPTSPLRSTVTSGPSAGGSSAPSGGRQGNRGSDNGHICQHSSITVGGLRGSDE
jgi:hypothetical protein